MVGFENVLVMTDVFSKYTLAVPTHDQHTSTFAHVSVTECFCKFGVPTRIHADQGRNFESSLIQELCMVLKSLALRHTIHPAMISANDSIEPFITYCELCQGPVKEVGIVVCHRFCIATTPLPISRQVSLLFF